MYGISDSSFHRPRGVAIGRLQGRACIFTDDLGWRIRGEGGGWMVDGEGGEGGRVTRDGL